MTRRLAAALSVLVREDAGKHSKRELTAWPSILGRCDSSGRSGFYG
jgi:hypothetical protein